MKTVLLATNNPHKVDEVRAIVSDLGITVLTPAELGVKLEVEETESTLAGNALLKAEAAMRMSGLPALADDTGLFVAALDGAPGILSARYAGPEASAEANMRKLLLALEGHSRRQAYFATVMAYVTPETIWLGKGILRGEIVPAPRGVHGFGYDPVFQPEGYAQTLAELVPEVKNRISHRRRALDKWAAYVRHFLSTGKA